MNTSYNSSPSSVHFANKACNMQNGDYDYPCNEAKPVDIGKSNGPKTPDHFTNSYAARYSNSRFANQHSFSNPLINLNSVVPVPSTNGFNANGCYYDVPKNIPVDPRFVTQTSMPIPAPITAKFPVNEPIVRPHLPQKSSNVMNKMSFYPTRTNYSNATLSKQSTSKPLPPLPNDLGESQSTQNYSVLPSKPVPVSNATKVNLISNICKHQDDDDEDYDCDYEYDYVCLESKKKLDNEDEDVKKLISKDLQLKYERLALNSSGLVDLQNIEKSMQMKNSINPMIRMQFLQSYSRLLSVSQNNFEKWIKLDLDIIERNHPSSVYINFTKHILLSGQNLLLVVKSLNRHFDQIENLCHFADQFYDYLRQIVTKTKKSAADQSASKSREEMAESIKNALNFTATLKVDFSKYY